MEFMENMMTGQTYLVLNIIVMCLQVICILSNGLILFMFVKLGKRCAGITSLVIVLVFADFVHALSTIPYISYLTIYWNSVYINYNPLFIMVSSLPLAVFLKINLTLTIAIAADRMLALHNPVKYRKRNHKVYATVAAAFGLSLGIFDAVLEFQLSPIAETPMCAAIGCFVGEKFRYYWGTSNMVLGTGVILATFLILCRLKVIVSSQVEQRSAKATFRKANQTTVTILVSSLVCITLPSVCVGFAELLGQSLFKTLGPFYIVGLTASGCCNGLMYIILNRDMQRQAKTIILGKPGDTTITR